MPTVTTYKDFPNGDLAPNQAGSAGDFNPFDYCEFSGSQWAVGTHHQASGTTHVNDIVYKVQRWNGAVRSTFTPALQSGDGYPQTNDFPFHIVPNDGIADAIIETDGSDLWIALLVLRTLANPYGAGNWTVKSLAVYHWIGPTGTGAGTFEYVGGVDGTTYNLTEGISNGWANVPGTTSRIAGVATQGKLFTTWAESGHEGLVADASHNHYRSRLVLDSFSTSARLVENEVAQDRTEDYRNTGGIFAFTDWADNGQVGSHDYAFRGQTYLMCEYEGSPQLFATEAVSRISGSLPSGGLEYSMGYTQPWVNCYSIDISTMAITQEQQITYTQMEPSFPATAIYEPASYMNLGGGDAHPYGFDSLCKLISLQRSTYSDPLNPHSPGAQIRYVRLEWHPQYDANTQPYNPSNYYDFLEVAQLVAISADLSSAPYPLDNDPALSWMIGKSEPLSQAFDHKFTNAFGRTIVEVNGYRPDYLLYTDRYGNIWFPAGTVSGDISQFDRRCTMEYWTFVNVTHLFGWGTGASASISTGGWPRVSESGTSFTFYPTVVSGVQQLFVRKWVFDETGDSFPTTPLMENFNYSNGTVGADWDYDGTPAHMDAFMQVYNGELTNDPVSGATAYSVPGVTFKSLKYNIIGSTTDSEVYATLKGASVTAGTGGGMVGLRIDASSGFNPQPGYWLTAFPTNSPFAQTIALTLYSYTGSTTPPFLGQFHVSVGAWPRDFRFGLRAVGTSIEIWYNAEDGLGWQLMHTFTDSAHSTGTFGVGVVESPSSGHYTYLDNFGAGAYHPLGNLDHIRSIGPDGTYWVNLSTSRSVSICTEVTTGGPSRIWFHKDGTWHQVGADGNDFELWLNCQGTWRQAKDMDTHTLFTYLDGTWEGAIEP